MTLTAPPLVEPRFVWVRYEPDPEPDSVSDESDAVSDESDAASAESDAASAASDAASDAAVVPEPRTPHHPVPPHVSRSAPSAQGGLRAPATRAHPPDRFTPLVPGSVRAGAREAAARRRGEIVVRIALEVLDGRRPAAHLAPYAVPGVLRYVVAGVPGHTREDGAPTMRSLHCTPVGRAAAEVTALCRFGPRFRALAARLDLTPTGDWRCTALRVL